MKGDERPLEVVSSNEGIVPKRVLRRPSRSRQSRFPGFGLVEDEVEMVLLLGEAFPRTRGSNPPWARRVDEE